VSDISDRYLNQDHNEELAGMLVLQKEKKRVKKKEQSCVVFFHKDIDKEIYCVDQWCKVVTEGPKERFFEDGVVEEAPVVHLVVIFDTEVSIPVRSLRAEIKEDVPRFRSEGCDVDNDNDPAPENVPVPLPAGLQQQDSLFGEWGATTLCHRLADDRRFENPKILKTRPDSQLGWFRYFLPMKNITSVLLVETSKFLPAAWQASDFGRVYSVCRFVAHYGDNSGQQCTSLFEQTEPSAWAGIPFQLNEYMSKKRFDDIVNSLRFTNMEPPHYRVKFHQVRQMITMWNQHMMDRFVAAWVSCLDESMSVWTSKWTCPGFMFVPRKHHPMGNEYHSICSGLSGIMYAIELVEGKDHPKEQPNAEYYDK
jgi:Transposase IS4